jgi:tetratricopeptide (TPR) repeat protein
VVGKTFYLGAVAELAPPALRPQVATHLMTLVRKELIRPDRSDFAGEEAFRFRHILIRDAAYDAMPKETRADLHLAFAGWLERTSGPQGKEYEEIVGYHLEQAYRYRAELGPVDETGRTLAVRAARLLAQAGRRAEGRADLTAATHLLERAGELLPPEAPDRLDIETDLAEMLSSSGHIARASSVARSVADRARALRDRGRELHAEVVRLRYEQDLGPEGFAGAALPVVEAAIAFFEREGDELGLARTYRLKANVYNMLADRKVQIVALERAIEHDRRAGNGLAEIEDLAYLATIYFWGPTPVREALPRCLELLEQVRGHRLHEARIERYVAGLMGMEGRYDEARAVLERVRQTFRELGSRFLLATTAFLVGPLEMWSGHLDVAERELREGCEALDAMGNKNALCSVAAFLAEVLYRQGRDDEAGHWVDMAKGLAATDDLEAQAHWRAVQAKILARRGNLDEGVGLAGEAAAIAKRTDEIEHVADVLVCQAEVAIMAGHREQAASILQEAHKLYSEKGVVSSVDRVEHLLEELTRT